MTTVREAMGGCGLNGRATVFLEYDDLTLALQAFDFVGTIDRRARLEFIHPVTSQPVAVELARNVSGRQDMALSAIVMRQLPDRIRLPMPVQISWFDPRA